MNDFQPEIGIADEVRNALAAGRGVVALESTLITHGLPWPHNLETARSSEAAVRAAGAVPSTIAILGGQIRIGLSEDELEQVARSTGFAKASRRDIGWVVATGRDAATTVSATLWLARRNGIGIMATGGLGGVHRGAGESFDISTDLDELASGKGSVVVCSGVKSILDIAATLEVMETRGIAVIGFGTNEFAAFTTVSSGLPLEARVDTTDEAAAVVRAHRALEVPGTVVIAQPVPEAVALDRRVMEAALLDGLEQARLEGITGKRVTPFLLDWIRGATEGRSLEANKALIVENAKLAGRLAVSLET